MTAKTKRRLAVFFLAAAVGVAACVAYVRTHPLVFNESLASIPAPLARHYRVVPVFNSPRVLRIALADPAELDTIDALAHLLGRELELCVAEASQLDEFVNRLYGSEGEREG